MATPRQIPGFYYDDEKKKYFRIQRNHTLPASSKVHTHQSVKTRNDEKGYEHRKKQSQQRQHVGHIQRSLLANSFGFELLQRRLGTRKGTITRSASSEFAKKLTSRPAWGTRLHDQGLIGVVCDSFHITREGLLTAFIDLEYPKSIASAWPSSTYGPDGYYVYAASCADVEEHHDINNYLSQPQLVTRFNVPYDNMVCSVDHPSNIEMQSTTGELVYKKLRLPYDAQIWSMATCPTSNEIAIGSGHGLFLARCPTTQAQVSNTPAHGRSSYICPHTIRVRLNEEMHDSARSATQMTVMFKDSNIIMSGERTGLVNFTDKRSATGIARLQHSSAVLGTLPTKNTNQIIVHGFSTTSIYDLRYTKAPKSLARRKNERNSVKIQNSSPVLEFAVPPERHADRHMPGQQLAYSADLDIVATCTTKAHLFAVDQSFVTLYSASTGRVLPGPLTNKIFQNPVNCIDIKRLRDGPESIVMLSCDELLEWTLHNDVDGSNWSDMTRGQKDDWFDWEVKVSRMVRSRPEIYSIARRWEDGNQGPLHM